MQIRLLGTPAARIYTVHLDFTGYQYEAYWTVHPPKYSYRWRDPKVPQERLDSLLESLKLRRITYWSIDRDSWTSHRDRRYVRYYTTVISDRMNKRYDVG